LNRHDAKAARKTVLNRQDAKAPRKNHITIKNNGILLMFLAPWRLGGYKIFRVLGTLVVQTMIIKSTS
jgi:hypothetical protein